MIINLLLILKKGIGVLCFNKLLGFQVLLCEGGRCLVVFGLVFVICVFVFVNLIFWNVIFLILNREFSCG